MTQGSIFKSIILYSIPLILGNFMQQLYNTFDSFIVGNYVSSKALAAVGASGQISFFLVAFYLGASSGAGILISQFYGAKRTEQLRKVIHNMLGIGLVLGVVITTIGVIFTPVFLKWVGTPDDMKAEAITYLRIFFGGMIFQVWYNMLAAVLNAVGNSRKSLQYLAISSVLNIGLDILFIRGFGMKVEGAAIATVISQAVCCILILIHLMRVDEVYRVNLREIRLEKYYVIRIIKVGLPAAIQNAVVSFSNLLIQSGVNTYGTNAVAGFTAYMKVDGFDILPIMSFSLTATTFVGQNIGAGKKDRATKGAIEIVIINMVYTAIMSVIMISFARPIISAFSSDPMVIEYGIKCIWALAPFYVLLGLIHSIAGVIRGTGNTFGPMMIILFSLCLFRILWISFVTPHFSGIEGVFRAYPASFILGSALMIGYIGWLKMHTWGRS